ncbi:hypothetical protein RHMOL_Rhmol07G0072100 [Rhododendron molle]|uniref:Uncharacterized protein n=1 Tax=Rhododendron molle TaxID=49168 RepID=A0ACC0MZ73_RHOML|nr:hypothetical protein RHMOL_Rhmol07G0072100 [Rhododendron molle]
MQFKNKRLPNLLPRINPTWVLERITPFTSSLSYVALMLPADDHILNANARPGFQRPAGSTSAKSYLEPVPTTEKGLLPAGFIMEDPDSHFVYVCRKMDETTDLIHVPSYPLTADVL